MGSVSLPVELISDTAFLTALYRSLESDRPDALFHDPYARILAGERGEELLQRMSIQGVSATGCIVRTHVMDELILQAIREDCIDTVINLGAGLDTRPYRLPLPSSLHWIEVDLPTVLQYKATKLADVQPECAFKLVALDITDVQARQAFLKGVSAVAKRVLIITEGLLIYMLPEQVSDLARDLSAQPEFWGWILDLASPVALEMIQRLFGESQSTHEAKLQFAPHEGADFFKPYGWQTVESRSLLAEGKRLKREIFPEEVLVQWTSPEHQSILQKLSSYILLTRAELETSCRREERFSEFL